MRQTRFKAIMVTGALVAALSVLFGACGGGSGSGALELVPQGSNLIAEVNLTGILNSDALDAAVESLKQISGDERTLEELLDEVTGEIGVDIRQISSLTFFGDTSRLDDYFGVIVQGSLEEADVVASVERSTGELFATRDYRGRRLYITEDDEAALASLDASTLILGTEEAVNDVIDVQDGNQKRLEGPILDSFRDLGSALFKLEIDVSSEELFEQFAGLGLSSILGGSQFLGGIESVPGVVKALRDLELIGLNLSENGGTLVLRANMDFASADSASTMGEFLEGILALASRLIPDRETAALLDKLEVSHRDSRVSIRFEVAASELGDLLSDLTGVSEVESSAAERKVVTPRTLDLGEEIEIMPTSFHVHEGDNVEYSTMPPTSGNHWETWANCGFYPEGLPDELITHNLEHGNIIVSFNLTDPSEVVGVLSGMRAVKGADEWGVFRFYDRIPEGTVVVSAWGRLATTSEMDLDLINQFFAVYAGRLGPERIPC